MTKKEQWEDTKIKTLLDNFYHEKGQFSDNRSYISKLEEIEEIIINHAKTLLAQKDKEMLDIRQSVVNYDEVYINEEVRMAINRMKKQLVNKIDKSNLTNK